MTLTIQQTLDALIRPRLAETALTFWDNARQEVATGASRARFNALIATASRHAKRHELDLSEAEREQADAAVPGWDPSGWNRLELLRVGLIEAHSRGSQAFADDYDAQFQFADEGETCALYRALPLLPGGERFVWRAADGCRTNMLSVFNAIALDSPYPVTHFDDTAWNQLVMKALFLEQPLYRIVGIDERGSAELTRMALDFAEERTSAGRAIIPEFWLCLGPHDSPRIQALADRLWPRADHRYRAAMAMGLARAGETSLLERYTQGTDCDEADRRAIDKARAGRYHREYFAELLAEQ